MRARRSHAVDTGGPDEQTASRAPEHGRGLGRSQVKAKAAPRFRPARRGRQDAAHEEHEGLERARAPSGEQRASSRGGRGPRGGGGGSGLRPHRGRRPAQLHAAWLRGAGFLLESASRSSSSALWPTRARRPFLRQPLRPQRLGARAGAGPGRGRGAGRDFPGWKAEEGAAA